MRKSVKGPYGFKIMQNFNSLGCLVLEISAFQYDAYHGFRVGASVHKLFVGGVCSVIHDVSVFYMHGTRNRKVNI